MIWVKVKTREDRICALEITGHAGFAASGKDIVCASLSSIVISSINLMLRFDEGCLSYNKSEGLIEVNILKHNDTTDKVLLNMIDHLKELEKNYKDNIKIYE